jgi:hypothetical protein
MSLWFPPKTIPKRWGVYRVQVPCPSGAGDPRPGTERFARYVGYWTCWAMSPDKAERLLIRGPSAGYTWADI